MPPYPDWLPLPVAMLIIPVAVIGPWLAVDFVVLCVRVSRLVDELRALRGAIERLSPPPANEPPE